MGLMDRVKAQANQLAQQAQEAAQEGRARIDQAQAGRRGDVLLRQLGALVFAERTGRGTADSAARIEQLIAEISAHENQNDLNLADPSQSGFGQSVFGQPPAGQPPAGQPPAGQPPAGQAPFGQSPFGQPTVPEPGYPAGGPPSDTQPPSFPDAGPGAFPQGSAGPSTEPPGSSGGMPSVDTTTSFFPAPGDGDDSTEAPPQS